MPRTRLTDAAAPTPRRRRTATKRATKRATRRRRGGGAASAFQETTAVLAARAALLAPTTASVSQAGYMAAPGEYTLLLDDVHFPDLPNGTSNSVEIQAYYAPAQGRRKPVIGISFGCQGFATPAEWLEGPKHEALVQMALTGGSDDDDDNLYEARRQLTAHGDLEDFARDLTNDLLAVIRERPVTDADLLRIFKSSLDEDEVWPKSGGTRTETAARIRGVIRATVHWIVDVLTPVPAA